MKAKYYIGERRNIDGNHVLHKEECPFLTDTDKAINLGMCHSPQMARNLGKLLFKKIDVCLFCCKEFHDQKRKDHIPGIHKKSKICLYNEITITWESALQSFLS